MLVDRSLRTHARTQPDKVAVVTAERSISYRELDSSVTYLAGHLLERGYAPGDRIAIHWSNSIEAVQLLLATFRAGMIAVPINLRLKSAEIACIFEHSAARLCFSEPALATLAEEARCSRGPDIVSELPTLTNECAPQEEVDATRAAVILYTSGTTAHPKGVTQTHRGLFESARTATSIPIVHKDTVLGMTQLAHASGLYIVLLPTLLVGATAVLLRTFDPAAALDLVERFGCTFAWGLPPMMQFVVEEQVRSPRNVSSVRTVFVGGDSASVALQQRCREIFGVEMREGYGLTESCPVIMNTDMAVRAGSMGRPALGVQVRLVDGNGDVKAGETGEILVRSPANCVGYWNDLRATTDLFANGWLRTGDLATLDEDGYYWFKGRLKQIIIRGGSNISPQEVEEVLYRHPAVLEAGIVGVPHPTDGEIPVAFVALRPSQSITEAQLLAHARSVLADYKLPERIIFVPELAKGLTEKVDRRRLRELAVAQSHSLEKGVMTRV